MFQHRLTRPLAVAFALITACTSVAPPASNALAVDVLRELPTQTYALRPGDASLGFSVKPFGFPRVRGTFDHFDGTVRVIDSATDGINVEAVVDLDTIKMGSDWYENVVKGPVWFDVENHPQATFSGALEQWDKDGEGSVVGEITIRGVTKPAEFFIRLNCEVREPCPIDAVGFTGEIEVDRTEFGMRSYRGFVGDRVRLQFSGALISE